MTKRAWVVCIAFFVLASFACHTAAADVDEIYIAQSRNYTDGAADPEASAPHNMWIAVIGSGLTSAAVTDPHGVAHTLVGDASSKELWSQFATEADLLAAFGPGNYTFTINGTDTVTITYSAAKPGGAAQILYPNHNDVNVSVDPTYSWASIAGLGDAVHVHVESDEETVFEELIPGANTTTWQPGTLQLNTWYDFELSVAKLQGGAPQGLQTNGGDDFTFYGVWAFSNNISFRTVQCDIFKIENVRFGFAPSAGPGYPPFGARFTVEGAGLTSVQVTTPSARRIDLQESEPGLWTYVASFDDALDALIDYGPGTYTFTFNEGADSISADWDVPAPLDYPEISYPRQWEEGVPCDPLYEWEPAAGTADLLYVFVADDAGIIYEEKPYDTSHVSWQPGPLAHDSYYRFSISAINIPGGQPQDVFTVGGDALQYCPVYSLSNSVHFSTVPELSLEEISVGFSKSYTDGVAWDEPYGIEIEVAGAGIWQVSVEDPHGGVHELSRDPMMDIPPGPAVQGVCFYWELEEQFATQAAFNAAWGPGDYTFSFNGGEDSVTVSCNPAEPTGFAPITAPAHLAHDVASPITFTWGSAEGMGDGLSAWLVEYPDVWDRDVNENEDMPISTTSWGPIDLQEAANYLFELSVFNFDGATVVTNGGREVGACCGFEYINEVRFDTGTPAPPDDITRVAVRRILVCEAGKPEGICTWRLEAEGTGIDNVWVRVPNGHVCELWNDGDWVLDVDFPAPWQMDEAFGPGLYTFMFNNAADSIAVLYDVPEPGGPAQVMYPSENGQEGVSHEPTFTWEPATGLGDKLGLSVSQSGTVVYEQSPVDIGQVAWQPGPLELGQQYAFEVGVINGGDAVQLQTTGGDDVDFCAENSCVNRLEFTTVPFSVDRVIIACIQTRWDCQATILVEGDGLDSVSVTAPNSASYQLWSYDTYRWQRRWHFTDLQEMQAAFQTGDYVFSFNQGADSATIHYEVNQSPSDFPTITYPLEEATVDINPVFTWDPAGGLADALWVSVEQWGEVAWEELPYNATFTSWQPGPLDYGTEYAFNLSAVNMQGGGIQVLPTDFSGQPFEYLGLRGTNDSTWFYVRDELEVWDIQITHAVNRVDGELQDAPYVLGITVDGAGIMSLTVQDPHGGLHEMESYVYEDDENVAWKIKAKYATIGELLAAWGPGDYTFIFNDGEDSATVTVAATQPGGFPVITYPEHNQPDVELDPLFEWESTAGMGDMLNAVVLQHPASWAFEYDSAEEMDINATEWEPFELEDDCTWELRVAVRNVPEEGYQELETDGGLPFLFIDAFDNGNSVAFDTGVGTPPDIDGIQISSGLSHADGVLDDFDPYFTRVQVSGTGIDNAWFTTPSGSNFWLTDDFGSGSYECWNWFQTEQEMSDVFGPGDYTFRFNNGADSVTIHYEAAAPLGVAEITHPLSGATVNLNPVYRWESADGLGNALRLTVSHWGDTVYEEFPADIATTSWQPGPLDPDAEYTFAASVVNIQPGTPGPLATHRGDDFTYTGTYEYSNDAWFFTNPPLSLDTVKITQLKMHHDGAVEPQPYLADIAVAGANITDVAVQDPHGGVHALAFEGDTGGGQQLWRLRERFSDLATLQAVWGNGGYLFTFNGGDDTVTIQYNVVEPTTFANITNPADGSHVPPGELNCAWDFLGTGGDYIDAWLNQDPAGTPVEYDAVRRLPINSTGWMPRDLLADTDYALGVAVVNQQGGGSVALTTDGGIGFDFAGTFQWLNVVDFDTRTPTLPTIDEVFLVKYAVQNPGPGESPFGADITVTGTQILDATLETPDGAVLHMDCYDEGCDLEFDFATIAEMNTTLPPGDYTFTFNGGADSVVVSHTVSEPTAFPVITNPTDGAVNVGVNPLYEWEPVTGADGLAMFVRDNAADEDIYEQWPVDLGVTSWQPGDLAPASGYNLEVSAVNIQGGSIQQLQTQQGEAFTYVGVFTRESNAAFTTAPMPDVNQVRIEECRNFRGGADEPVPWEMIVDVEGAGITDVSVEAPSGTVYQLINDDGEWTLSEGVENYATLADLRAAFGTGNYAFTFNGGFDAVTIAYAADEPLGAAQVTTPAHGSTGNPVDLVFEWLPATGLGDVLEAELEGPAGLVYGDWNLDIATTTWAPGPLEASTAYSFELDVVNFQGGAPMPMQTNENDDFTCMRSFAYSNTIDFDTNPINQRRLDGDTNDDCWVNILDLIAVRNKINQDVNSGENWWMDVNDDGKINILDLIYVRNRINTRCED